MNFMVISNSKLNIESLEDNLFRLTSDFSIVLKENNHNFLVKFTVSKGAIFDGLSIPFGLRWFLPVIDYTNDLYSAAGLIHDGLYASELVSKEIADDIFRGILRDSGISRFKAGCAHQAVMKFAKKHYGKHQDEHNLKYFMDMNVNYNYN